MKKLAVFGLILSVCALYAIVFAQPSQVTPKAELLKSIDRGKTLFNDPKLGATGKSCNDCHVAGGTRDGTMGKIEIKAFRHLAVMYPRFFMMTNRVMTLDQMVNWCIVTPMKGTALSWDDQRLADLVAYAVSVKPEKEATTEKAKEGMKPKK
jgi:cytochrome c